MGYAIKRQYCKIDGMGSWFQTDVDLASATLNDINKVFTVAHIEVENSDFNISGFLDLKTLKGLIPHDVVIRDYIEGYTGNSNLLQGASQIILDEQSISITNLLFSEFTLTAAKAGLNYVSDTINLTDILVSHEDPSKVEYLHHNCIILVNGVVKPTSLTEDGLILIDCIRDTDGMDYLDIQAIELDTVINNSSKVNLTSDMIVPLKTGYNLKDRLVINLDIDLNDKGIILVIGGFLHILDSTYNWSDEGLLTINYSKLNMMPRLMDLSTEMDFEKLQLNVISNKPFVASRSDFYKDSFIQSLINLDNTYIVVFDHDVSVDGLRRDISWVTASNNANLHVMSKKPVGLFKTNRGRYLGYNYSREGELYSVRTPNVLTPKYTTLDQDDANLVTDSVLPADPTLNYYPRLVNYVKQHISFV